jgi:Tat protein secretion system quality control protein TatD with DNase activity
MVEHGFYFTVGVEVLLSQHIQDIARYLPAELMLTETDNPGGNRSITGTMGTPSLIKDVVEKLADTRGASNQTIMTTVQDNLARVGGDDRWPTRLRTSGG